MGASQGRVGINTIIEMGDGLSPEGFDAIPEPKDIDGPEITQEFADATHMQSPSGFRERKPTVKSNSQVTFRCNKLAGNTVQDALIAAAMAQPPTLKNFTMTYPDGDVIPFAAYPSVRFTSPMLGMMEIHVTLSLTGGFVHSEPSTDGLTGFIVSKGGEGKCLFLAAAESIPSGWHASDYDDSAWEVPVATGISSYNEAYTITAVEGTLEQFSKTLFRHKFQVAVPQNCKLYVSPDDWALEIYLNGVKVFEEPAELPSLNMLEVDITASQSTTGENVLAFHVGNRSFISFNPISLAWRLEQTGNLSNPMFS